MRTIPRTDRYIDRRLAVVLACAVIWVIAIGSKLIRLQVIEHDQLLGRAERQQQSAVPVTPKRGIIYDRNGNELARSVEVQSLYASPGQVADPGAAAAKLAAFFGLDAEGRETIYNRLTARQVQVAIKRKLTEDEARQVQALGIPGLQLVNEMKRYYVNGRTAAQVLGFVDVDEHGMGGIELSYDKLIQGKGGRVLQDVDALKTPYDHAINGLVPGGNVVLTLDTLIQDKAEKALEEAVKANKARGGTIVVLRPGTGEILAMAGYPGFDPNIVGESSDQQRRNPAIENAFEPGSIFKIVTYSAALEEGLIRPQSLIDCGRGEIHVANRVIHDGHGGVMTAMQAFAKSSNVAAIKVGEKVGLRTLSTYIDRFGFGKRTGIELPAESRGLLRSFKDWQPASIAAIPIGYEIGVTALQGAAAMGCIANGGEWVKPYLVSQAMSSSGNTIESHHDERRRVISSATASTLKEMLEGVVVHGTGKKASIGAYPAAGKTGTARKVDPATGRYSHSRYSSSFVGFAPIKNPRVVCIVSIDEPQGKYYGGDVAAPVFAQVVAEALQVLGVDPENDVQSEMVAGDFRTYDTPRETVESGPEPAGAARAREGQESLVQAPTEAIAGPHHIVVPNLIGKGIREAIALCAGADLRISATGDGLVVSQSPAAGEFAAGGSICRVELSRVSNGKERAAAEVARSSPRSSDQKTN
jgi:cell division protein FtsI (penicillin-binding protein 3)